MSDLFLRLVNGSINAGWLVLVILLLRLVLKRSPKWVRPALWGLVGLRLLLPVSIESPWSLLPSAETVPLDIAQMGAPAIHSGLEAVNAAVNPVLAQFSFGLILRPVPIRCRCCCPSWPWSGRWVRRRCWATP